MYLNQWKNWKRDSGPGIPGKTDSWFEYFYLFVREIRMSNWAYRDYRVVQTRYFNTNEKLLANNRQLFHEEWSLISLLFYFWYIFMKHNQLFKVIFIDGTWYYYYFSWIIQKCTLCLHEKRLQKLWSRKKLPRSFRFMIIWILASRTDLKL